MAARQVIYFSGGVQDFNGLLEPKQDRHDKDTLLGIGQAQKNSE